MDIDQRIDALTQSVELLASMHKDSEVHIAEWHEENKQRIKATDKQIKNLGGYIRTVAHRVFDHEARLRGLEGEEPEEKEGKE